MIPDFGKLNAVFVDRLARRFADDLLDAVNIVAGDHSWVDFSVRCGNFNDTLCATVSLRVAKYEDDFVDHFDEVRFFYGVCVVEIVRTLGLAVDQLAEKLDEHEEDRLDKQGGAA